MNDQSLKQALAKMLPELLVCQEYKSEQILYWRKGFCKVRELELLGVCHLISGTFDVSQSRHFYNELVSVIFPYGTEQDPSFRLSCASNATWQQRTPALAKVKNITIEP